MLHRRTHVALLIVGTVLAQSWPAAAQQTAAADRFVDSVGVNIHLHYDNTAYRTQFPLIKSRLLELGIRHVRDGLIDTMWRPYFERHNELGEAGIKGTFITSPEQSTEVWASYPSRVKSAFEAYEAPNEYDKSRKPDWARVLTETLERLRGLKNDPRVGHFPLYGPSLTSAASYAALGDVSAFYDFSNLHNYFAGRHPGTQGWGSGGYGSIAWNLDLAARYSRGKPVVTTETGYQDSPTQKDSVPPEIAARYLPIVLLEQFRAGIVRTFLYELCDFPKSGSYGLLTADGSPKPAFTAVKSLLNLLADPGETSTPVDLEYAVQDASGHARHIVFQKRNGSYFVALWQSRSSYNPATRTPIAVPEQRISLTVPRTIRYMREHRWENDGSRSDTSWSMIGATIPVTLGDRLVVIEVAPTLPSQ